MVRKRQKNTHVVHVMMLCGGVTTTETGVKKNIKIQYQQRATEVYLESGASFNREAYDLIVFMCPPRGIPALTAGSGEGGEDRFAVTPEPTVSKVQK